MNQVLNPNYNTNKSKLCVFTYRNAKLWQPGPRLVHHLHFVVVALLFTILTPDVRAGCVHTRGQLRNCCIKNYLTIHVQFNLQNDLWKKHNF